MKTTMEELAPYMRGWRSYFGFCETPESVIVPHSVGSFAAQGGSVAAVEKHRAVAGRRCLRWGFLLAWPPILQVAGTALGISHGLRLLPEGFPMRTSNRSGFLRWSTSNGVTSRTAVYGPVCTVVWQGSAGDRRRYADQYLTSGSVS